MSDDTTVSGINVTNLTDKDIYVSINQWGNDCDTTRNKITKSDTEHWERSDQRGFVMTVKIENSELPYFVRANSGVIVAADKVTVNGRVIKPAD
jgi:hypothetical protein